MTEHSHLIRDPHPSDVPLDLDEFLAGPAALAEKNIRISTEPWRQTELDNLLFELDNMTDAMGRPLDTEQALGEGRSLAQVAQEVKDAQQAAKAATRTVRMRQMSSTDFTAFKDKHATALAAGGAYPDALWDELIAACAIAPAMSVEKVAQLRSRIGGPAFDLLAYGAWGLNVNGGLEVPPLSAKTTAILQRMNNPER